MSKVEEFSIINQINSGQIKSEPTPFPRPVPTNPDKNIPAQINRTQVPNPKPDRSFGNDW